MATLGPRANEERRAIKEKWDVDIPVCPGPPGSQDSLAALARPSTAKMETEGPRGLQERLAGLACRGPWGCRASVSRRPALEPRPTRLPAL